MTRIAIIDHETHNLIVEDIDDEILESKYGGEEEAYIKDNYDLSDNWSWDYIVQTTYYPIDEDGCDVDFEDLL